MLDCNGRPLDLGRPLVMGILNVTPDSFSDGGQFFCLDKALAHARQMVADGADIIDIGGESTRPGAPAITVEEELSRVVPVIEVLANSISLPISIDTMKSAVMRAAWQHGAGLINDVSALQADPQALATVADLGAPVCLTHMKGTPRTMQENPEYEDVCAEVFAFLRQRAEICIEAGIPRDRIVLDPGIGFGKRVVHNLALLKHLPELIRSAYPVLIGVSRKSFIGKVLDLPVEERLEGGLALAVIAAWQGARIIRTHDVAATARALRMTSALLNVN